MNFRNFGMGPHAAHVTDVVNDCGDLGDCDLAGQGDGRFAMNPLNVRALSPKATGPASLGDARAYVVEGHR